MATTASELHLSVAQDEIGYDAQWPRSRDEQQPEAACLAPRFRVSINPEHGYQGQDEDGEKAEAAETRAQKVESIAIIHDVVTPPELRGAKVPALRERGPPSAGSGRRFGVRSSPQGFVLWVFAL